MAIQPDHWETIKKLFEAALEEDPANRSSFLKEQCSDLSLRGEVERLLSEHDQAGTFLSTPALGNFSLETESPSQALSVGEVLAGRFRILHFIAGGGMGEVYEAEDQELRDRVAVKTIRPEIVAQPNAVPRFKREVHLARKVTHPNVCRIFDMFRHKAGEPGAAETVFISMELLHGKTLGARLKEGRMSEEEALPLVRQMASALAAAHAVGIVHRDFKPGNVVLVDVERGDAAPRAVVTDFGLALQSLEMGERISISTGLGLLGTPAYMAPEQLEGRAATPASDVYALGLVIYEMIAGERPFQGDTPMLAAMKRLTQNPVPPRKFQRGLSGALESVILRCLERDPVKRFASATDVIDALNGCGQTAESKSGFRHSFLVLAVGVSLIVILSTAGVRYLIQHRQGATSIGSDSAPRRSIAVLGFHNLSGSPDVNWISTALSEELSDELSAGQQLRIVPGETVARLKADLSLPQTDSLASETLATIRKALGTDIVVTGSYLNVANRLRVDVQLKNAVSGDTIATVSDTANQDQMLELVSRVGEDLREKCGVVPLTSAQSRAVKSAQAANPMAARFYAEGLEELRAFNAAAARASFESAIGADSNFALAHSALASTWLQLGYDVKGKAEAERAMELANSLSQEDHLSIEAQFYEAGHDQSKAVETLRSLFQSAPDNPEYGLRLVNAQLANGQPSDAANTLATLRKLPLAPNDGRIDLAEANIERSFGDFKKSLAAASLAERKAETVGARILTAWSLMRQSGALDWLGQQEEAIARGEKARRIFSEAGDRDDFAKMNTNLALILVRQSKFEEAKRRYQESLDEFHAIGDKRGEEVLYAHLAWVAELQDDLDGAQRLYEKSLALARELDDKARIPDYIGDIALILSYKGDLSGAISKKEQVLAIAKESGQTELEAQTRIDLVGMFVARGDLNDAKELLAHADALLTRNPNSRSRALSLQAWGDILAAGARLPEAHQKYQSAVDLARQSKETQLLPYCQLSLAELEIEEHRAADAEKILSDVIEYFHAQKNKGGEAWGLGDYARSELELGHIESALTSAQRAEELAKHDRSLSGLDVHWVAALTEGLNGNPQQAAIKLQDLAHEAEKQGNVVLAFKVRLAQGEIAMQSHAELGRKALSDLSKAAAARGFLMLAQEAQALMKKPPVGTGGLRQSRSAQ